MSNRTNIRINGSDCLDCIFSTDIRQMCALFVQHINAVDKELCKLDTDSEELTAILSFLTYVETHDFVNHRVSTTSDNQMCFPYLPNVLLAPDEIKNILCTEFGADFITISVVYYLRDAQILKHVYDFVVNTKCLTYDTNQFIYHLQTIHTKIYRLIKDYMYKHLSKFLKDQIRNYDFEPQLLDLTTLNEYAHEHKKEDDEKMQVSPEFFDVFIPLFAEFGMSGSMDSLKSKLGDLAAPQIGETVDIKTLFPFNVKIVGNVVTNIEW